MLTAVFLSAIDRILAVLWRKTDVGANRRAIIIIIGGRLLCLNDSLYLGYFSFIIDFFSLWQSDSALFL